MARSASSRARYSWPLGGLRLPRDPWWLNIYVILSSILSQTVSVIIFYMHPNQKPLPRSKAKQCVAAVSNNKHIHFCFFGSLQIERLSGGHQLATRSRSLFFRGSGTDCFNVAPCHLFKSETFHISTKLLSCRSPRALLPGGVVPLSPYTIRL